MFKQVKYLVLLVALLLPGLARSQNTGTGVNPPVGSVWTYLGPTFGAGWDISSAGVTVVPNNAVLQGIPVPATNPVLRTGFYKAGDDGAALYNYSSINCTAPDNGAQVSPGSGGGCWVADFTSLGSPPTPMVWGAAGDGVTDDTLCLQRMINALQGTGIAVNMGRHTFKVNGLVAAKPITIRQVPETGGVYITNPGYGNGNTVGQGPCTSGFLPLNASETLLTIQGDGSIVDHVCFQMAANAGTQTAGAAIWVAAANSVQITNNQINNPFDGIVVGDATDGTHGTPRGHTQTNSTLVLGNIISSPSDHGIEIGKLSSANSTVGTILRDNSITCFFANTNSVGIAHYDSAGTLQNNANGPFSCNIGTLVLPGTGASSLGQGAGIFFTNDIEGDSSLTNDLLIDTSTTLGIASNLKFTNSWTSMGTGHTSVLIRNTGGGGVINIQFVGQHFNAFSTSIAGPLVDIESGVGITVANSTFNVLNSFALPITVTDGLKLGGTATLVTITNNNFVPENFFGGAITNGIHIVANANNFNIQGNSFPGSIPTPLLYTPNGESAVITGNPGLSTLLPTIASAATMSFPNNEEIIISGTAAIANITNSAWSNRKLVAIPSGTWTTTTGGNVCNAVTAALNVPRTFYWNMGGNCWNVQ